MSQFLCSRPTGAVLPSAGIDNFLFVEGSAVPPAVAATGNPLTVEGNVSPVYSLLLGKMFVLLKQKIASIKQMFAEQ